LVKCKPLYKIHAGKRIAFVFSLDGKIAIITGGGTGLGRAVSIRFARAGARIVVANRSNSSQLAEKLGGVYIQTDVSKEEQMCRLMEETINTFGRIDIIVNNAGIFVDSNPVEEISSEDLELTLNVNLKGVVWGIKHGARAMADGGSIINIASIAGLSGVAGYGNYVMSKAGVIGITKAAAMDLAPRAIRCNCICPSSIDAGMTDDLNRFDEKMKKIIEIELARNKILVPLGRLGKAEEFAALCHFLASDDSAFITGAIIPLDGGRTAGVSQTLINTLTDAAFCDEN
jgi:3alpha(or 20beta)-hydroxysteroid dehydrogenase